MARICIFSPPIFDACFLQIGEYMTEELLRKQIEIKLNRIESDTQDVNELAYLVWESEKGPLMEGISVRSFGPKRVLKALGYEA